jgi:hypothetical protein
MLKRAGMIGVAIGVAVCLPATAWASGAPNPKAELLGIRAMPAGWSTTPNVKSTATGCGKVSPILQLHSTGWAEASFEVSAGVPLYQGSQVVATAVGTPPLSTVERVDRAAVAKA